MSKQRILWITGAALLFSMQAWAAPQRFTIDQDHFSVGFLVDHIGYAQQLGQFLEGSGSFVYDPETDALVEGEVVVQADSVFTNHTRRDRHLKGSDFLDVRDHDTLRFVATGWDGETQTLTGELTILGQTRTVSWLASVNALKTYPFGHGKPTLGVSVRGELARSEWGMTYGLEGDLVGDTVEVIIELEAIAQD